MSATSLHHFYNGRIFTGENWYHELTFRVEKGRILALEPGPAVPDSPEINTLAHHAPEWQNAPADIFSKEKFLNGDLQGGYLVPAFLDLQLYGGNGLLFGVHPTLEALEATVAYSRNGGAHLILPTVATNDNSVALAAMETIRQYWEQGGTGVYGLHLEGPFINPAKKGAHSPEKIQAPSRDALQALVEPGRGVVKMMTIAPELFTSDLIQYLQDAGIVVSAGHSNADYAEANRAFNQGISTCTHLFNAMSPLQHRAPGLAGAILSHPSVASSIVPDGHHVDAVVVRLAKQLMGDRLFIITDAVTENKEGNYLHQFRGDRYTLPDGTLSGSALTMLSAVQFCIREAGITPEEAFRMAALYPARVIGLEQDWGKLEPGWLAEWLWIPSL